MFPQRFTAVKGAFVTNPQQCVQGMRPIKTREKSESWTRRPETRSVLWLIVPFLSKQYKMWMFSSVSGRTGEGKRQILYEAEVTYLTSQNEMNQPCGLEKWSQCSGFFLMTTRLQKEGWLCISLREDESASHFIHYWSKRASMISIASYKSSNNYHSSCTFEIWFILRVLRS